jgi:hypothetical protein
MKSKLIEAAEEIERLTPAPKIETGTDDLLTVYHSRADLLEKLDFGTIQISEWVLFVNTAVRHAAGFYESQNCLSLRDRMLEQGDAIVEFLVGILSHAKTLDKWLDEVYYIRDGLDRFLEEELAKFRNERNESKK